MFRIHPKFASVFLIFCAVFAGCRSGPSLGSQNQGSGTAPVVLAMTDTPPTNTSILSAEVTLTGATLNPGNVPVFSGSTTVELTRLQTDIAYLATTKVVPGTYTSLTLTFSNPMLTFENDTGSPVTFGVGSPTCAAGAICTIHSVATNLSTPPITLSPAMTLSANTGAGLLVDVNLNNLLSATLGADFSAGTTVSQFTPAGSGTPLVGDEDVVGQVGAISATNSTFSLQNATATYSLLVDTTTTFLNFPTGTCTTPSIACVQANQILSVDISIRADGTAVAKNVLFEDANSTDTEVEGIITSINTGSQQFTMVTLTESATITGLKIGDVATVHYPTIPPAKFFDKDLVHADNASLDTTTFLFAVPTDLIVGQQVQVRRNPASSGTSITADRVRLRSSRVSGTYQTGPPSAFTMGTLPSLFTVHAISPIQVQTSSGSVSAICTGIGLGTPPSCSALAATHVESVRGPLFANGTTPTIVASKVIQH
jgi:hypothetical protein